MHRRVLGQTGLEVSALGFGCAKLTAQPRADALKVLETAYAQGITHFDVARLYGLGWAEGILGEFLQGKRNRVTVTTKFGLQPPGGWVTHRRLVYAAKKVLGIFPPVVKLMRKRAHQGVQGGRFTPEDALKSLQTSLRELKTDYIDILLLHECDLADASAEPLVRALESQLSSGTVRNVGIGSDFSRLPTDLGRVPTLYKVIQFNHNAHTRNLLRLTRDGRALSTHTIFGPAAPLLEAIRNRPDAARQCAQEIGIERLDAKAISSLLLHYDLQTNPDGLVLFASINAAHVEANALDAATSKYDSKQMSRFVEFVDAMLGAIVAEQPARN
ncbi:MAG TPA: aldo/keto reductase [Tepidisphaeraceae bacterium]|jgi:diketogulonate reductase-like aldo/keto reductase|nr:aldo/keto reductase [Tepidisphaeraceae bacterium]